MRSKRGVVQEILQGLGIECQEGSPPIALPKDEAQAAEVMAEANRHQWRMLPVGLAHQLGHVRPDSERFDLWLSTRRMQKVVQYEPGEATITVQPGVLWQHVQSLAGEHRQCLSPSFDPEIPRTVGGVLGAGFSGLDRPLRGALRHQVLGMRVLMADGSIALTGGRLVKNVAGFDLHRLHTGGRGQLGVILETSLRLHNQPAETVVLNQSYDSLQSGVAASRRLHSARLPGNGLLLRFEASGRSRLSCVLQGSPGLIEDARKASALAMDFEEQLDGDAALRAQASNVREFDMDPCDPWLSITCQPTAIEDVQRALGSWLQQQNFKASGILQPDVAHWSLRLHGLDSDSLPPDAALAHLSGALREFGAATTPLGTLRSSAWDPGGHSPAPLQQAVEALRQRFDPENRFQARLA
ncbi:MAG: hypothetical protein ACI87O_001078 [Planctomycetota bacterium]|jgi:hypothetical protein